MKVTEEVAALAADVQPGATERFVCPVCHGGSSGERSLAITKGEAFGYLFYCHRASCGARGAQMFYDGGATTPAPPPKLYPLPNTGSRPVNVGDLSPHYLAQLFRVFNLGQEHLVIDALNYYEVNTVHRGCLRFKCRGADGRELGYHDRAIGEASGKKYVRNWPNSDLFLASYVNPEYVTHRASAPMWIVEDILSAIRIADLGGAATCIFGTNLTEAHLRHLERSGFRRYKLALDKDATVKSIDACRTFRDEYLFDVVPVLMWDDAKDMKRDELIELIKG